MVIDGYLIVKVSSLFVLLKVMFTEVKIKYLDYNSNFSVLKLIMLVLDA